MTAIEIVAGGAPGDFLTVRHLRAEGSNRQIGRTLAAAAKRVHGAAAGPRRSPAAEVQRARRRWFERNHPVLAERILGVGDALGVDPACDSWDLAMLGTYEVPAGCSSVLYPGPTTKHGHTLLARNFDFPTATLGQIQGGASLPGERPLAADPWLVELHPDEGYASLVVGIMDVMGGMDGINSAGLTVTLLADDESPNQEPSGAPQVGLSEQQIVRYLLDTCATVDEAKQALLMAKQYYLFVPCHFLVADARGCSFVWEYSPGHNIEHIVEVGSPATERVVCTNHLLHRWPDPSSLPEHDETGIAGHTYQRWRTLDSQVTNGSAVDRLSAREQLGSVAFTAPDIGVRTLWSSVYDLDARAVDISFYLHDAAGHSRYTQPLHFSLA
jgi:hypothetical protein